MSEEKANSNGSVKKNYYEILQITPTTESENIRMLAARFHPDNVETGNLELFLGLTAAYKVLSDPAAKADYDRTLEDNKPRRSPYPRTANLPTAWKWRTSCASEFSAFCTASGVRAHPARIPWRRCRFCTSKG